MKKKAYRSTEVKQVRLEAVLSPAPPGAVTVGLDIGKYQIYGVVRWADGTFERPWKVANPSELEILVELLQALAKVRAVTVGMESTGTYGDALRRRLSAAGLVLQRVGGKAASDYAEIFDGVPSQHDGKDAAVVAELVAFGKSRLWPFVEATEAMGEMAYWVDWLDAQQKIQQVWTGRLEGLLARHWPECTRMLKLTSVTLLSLLAHYGGPEKLAQDSSAASQLAKWGLSRLTAAKIALVLSSAAQTAGTRQGTWETQRMQKCASLALASFRETQEARGRLAELVLDNEVLQRQALVVGEATACVHWVTIGDPRDYPCGEAYRKAMGLNLKERSSGRYQGRLKITKRGPSIARRWLYFAAMRTVQEAPVRRWYEAKKAKDQDCGMGALVAVMRKLSLASYAAGVRGETFDPARLFPGSCIGRAGRPTGRVEATS